MTLSYNYEQLCFCQAETFLFGCCLLLLMSLNPWGHAGGDAFSISESPGLTTRHFTWIILYADFASPGASWSFFWKIPSTNKATSQSIPEGRILNALLHSKDSLIGICGIEYDLEKAGGALIAITEENLKNSGSMTHGESAVHLSIQSALICLQDRNTSHLQ